MNQDMFNPAQKPKACTDEPCPPTGRAAVPAPGVRFEYREVQLPEFTDALAAATVARHAVNKILDEQAAACTRIAEPWAFNLAPAAAGEDFAREMILLMEMAWTDFTYKYMLKPNHPQNALDGALVVPYWAAAQPMFGAAAIQRNIPVITSMWPGLTEPEQHLAGKVLVLHSDNHMPPSLLEQNYTVVAAYPFTTGKATS